MIVFASTLLLLLLLPGPSNAISQPAELISEEQYQASFEALFSDLFQDPTYYSSLNPSLYSELDSRLNDITTKYFPEDAPISDYKTAIFGYYTMIPESRKDALGPAYTSAFESYSSLYSTITTWSTYPTTPSSTSSWDTKVTGTVGYLSDYYVLAKCNALINDINQYGHLYNSFCDDQMSINRGAVLSFLSQLDVFYSYTWMSDVNQYCNTLVEVIDIFPWEDRLLDQAKKNFYTDYVPFTGEIFMGSKELTPEVPSYNTAPVTVTDTSSPVTVTDYHPMVVKYYLTVSLGDSTAILPTNTTTYATITSVVTTGEATNTVVQTTPTITAYMNELLLAGADALIYDYNSNTGSYESFIKENINDTFVQNYIRVIEEYKEKDGFFYDNAAYQEVLLNFYNFIFQLPPEFKTRLQDRIGYAFMGSQTNGPLYHSTTFTDGAGDFFKQVFKFGYNNSFVDWTTKDDGATEEVTKEVTEYFPIFPTILDNDVMISIPEANNTAAGVGQRKAGGFGGGLFGLGG